MDYYEQYQIIIDQYNESIWALRHNIALLQIAVALLQQEYNTPRENSATPEQLQVPQFIKDRVQYPKTAYSDSSIGYRKADILSCIQTLKKECETKWTKALAMEGRRDEYVALRDMYEDDDPSRMIIHISKSEAIVGELVLRDLRPAPYRDGECMQNRPRQRLIPNENLTYHIKRFFEGDSLKEVRKSCKHIHNISESE